ncbi:hypothetical protein B0H34DRAFT_625253, partial [Crassisporium funariophilum]
LRKMRKLKQTGSCAAFTNQFIEILAELDWTEQTKVQEYYDRLKENIKTTLCNRKGRYFTNNFDDYSKLCIEIDNELHTLSLDNTARNLPSTNSSSAPRRFMYPTSSSSATPFSQTTATTSSTNNQVVPMEVDTVKFKILTEAEKIARKEERKRLGLCLYCGQGQHMAANCPNKKPRA